MPFTSYAFTVTHSYFHYQGILSSFELSVIDINSIDGPIMEYLYKRIHRLVSILSLCGQADSRNILGHLHSTEIMSNLTRMNFFLLKSSLLTGISLLLFIFSYPINDFITDVTLELMLLNLNLCAHDGRELFMQQLFANEVDSVATYSLPFTLTYVFTLH